MAEIEISENGQSRIVPVDAPTNSKKSKEPTKTPERKELKQVTKNAAQIKKKSIWKRMGEAFTGDDRQSVGEYLLFDVAIPATKDFILNMGQLGLERALFGDSRPNRSRRSSERNRHVVSYGNMYRSEAAPARGRERDSGYDSRARRDHDFDLIVLESRGEAEEVLACLEDILEEYKSVRVNDLYNLVGIRGSYMDDKWGWTNLRGAGSRMVRGGWVLELPTPVALDRM